MEQLTKDSTNNGNKTMNFDFLYGIFIIPCIVCGNYFDFPSDNIPYGCWISSLINFVFLFRYNQVSFFYL